MVLARYTFLPWLRRGAASAIGVAAAGSRARIELSLALSDGTTTGAAILKSFPLVGPGDVVGISPDLVIRTEPRPWVTDFEPNYLAFAEFYDEDFCWRHTPAPPDLATHRLTPWISLMVLAEGEFDRSPALTRPLASLTITASDPAGLFPPADQAWAWAHVQLAADLGGGTRPDEDLLAGWLEASPDRGLCRLVSPRRLLPRTAYHAFVVPTFEVGRKAGLGLTIDDNLESGTAIAWATGAAEFPIYYEWYFQTGEGGSFEDLVQRIQPRPVDRRVGVRDMDISAPGFRMPDVAEPVGPGHHRGIVGLEGALRAPTMEPKPPDPSSRFGADVARIVNAPADAQDDGSNDPVVAPPLTGGWHALVNRVDPMAAGEWVNGLNVDARNRAASGLGARVIRTNQERYMRSAWEQVGEIIAANRKVAGLRFASVAAGKLFTRHLEPAPDAKVLPMIAPLFARVLGSPMTVRALLGASRLPDAAMSSAFRKLTRPRGLLARMAVPPEHRPDLAGTMALRANDLEISAAPAPPAPHGPTVGSIAAGLEPTGAVLWWLRNGWWVVLLLLGLAVLAPLVLAGGAAIAPLAVLAAGLGYAGWSWSRARAERAQRERLDLASLTPERFRPRPPPGFGLSLPGSSAAVPLDAAEAENFSQAQQDFGALLSAHPAPLPERPAFDVSLARRKVMAALDPSTSYARSAARRVTVGTSRLGDFVRDTYANDASPAGEPALAPVMAYPDMKEPMYRPLAALSDELMVPNLGLIPPNSISLMLTNPPFIESYMAGLNHDFARELLWREYPTDYRGSPFRQFWEAAMRPTPGLEGKAREQALKDIKPLNEWLVPTALGTHGNVPGSSADRRVVLVVRADLLKRYPNTLVYAQRARWSDDPRHKDELAVFDEKGEKALAGIEDPNIAYPVINAFLPADLYFIGFDLALDEVRGDPVLEESAAARGSIPAAKLGWFFVLQEVPGELRLGMDEDSPPPAMASDFKWDNFAWANIAMTGRSTIDLAAPLASEPTGTMPAGRELNWRAGSGATAADVAAILSQKPVMVAWHARQMLERGKLDEP